MKSEPNSPQKEASPQQDFRSFSRGPLIATATGGLLIFLVLGVVGSYFESEIVLLTQRVADLFGIWGLSGFTFFGDSLFTPFPPDIALVIISKSAMKQDWPLYVGIIALTSFVAGNMAYGIGRLLIQIESLPSNWKSFPKRHEDAVKKFGPWAVILGAITPLPFSFTCMSAGFLRMRYSLFVVAALTRIVRVYAYYFVISSSGIFRHLF